MTYHNNNIFENAHRVINSIGKLNFIRNLLPNGEVEAGEFIALNPTRLDKRLGSFRINTITGKWSDFATNDRGGDLIALYAYLKGVSNYEAACAIVGVQPSNKNRRG
jgi:hypothetical protein